MSIQPIPPTSAPTTAGQLVSRAYQNDQALASWLGDHDGRLTELESQSGTPGSGLVPDPDYPGYYVISEGGDPGAPPDYPPTITLGVSADGLDVTATFTASDPEGDPVAVHIDWGDGNTTTLATSPAEHTYATSGTYTVTATATAGGKTGTDSADITVQQQVSPGAYTAAVLADSPVFYAPFNETALPYQDVVSSTTLTSIGAVEASPVAESIGTLSRSASFTKAASADYSVYDFALPATSSAFSVELAARPLYLDRVRHLFGTPTFTLRMLATGAFSVWGGTGWVNSPDGILSPNEPYHLAVSVTAESLIVYANGQQVASLASHSVPTAQSQFRIGGANTPEPAPLNVFRGNLAGLAIYDRAITQTEVANHYAALGIGA